MWYEHRKMSHTPGVGLPGATERGLNKKKESLITILTSLSKTIPVNKTQLL